MAEDAARWRSDIFGILPHPTEPRVLLLRDGNGWTLPRARLERGIWLDKLGIVTEGLRRVLGAGVRAHRYARYDHSDKGRWEEGIYVLEGAADPARIPPAGRWIDRDDLEDLPLRHPAHRAVLDTYFREAAGGIEPERQAPWARSGWFNEAAAWIAAQLSERGRPLAAPVEQIRNFSLSCILRAPTAAGAVYFKVAADFPLFVDEPLLTTALAARFPGRVPAPLAIDRARRWMLTEDFGRPIGWDAPLATREALLRAFGELQIAAAESAEGLLALGCVDRRLDRLAAGIDPLLADPVALNRLDEDEVARLRRLAPRLRAMCGELAAYGVPQTLVHGDLHGDNVAGREGAFVFFDWTDACLSHPFFDLMTILDEEEATQARLRDAYLALWIAHEPPERLLAAWALARPLCALHHAISYQTITNSLEARTKQEFHADAARWLRHVLRLMPE